MSTGCGFHADALAEHAAGRLDPDRRHRLEAHVADCEACRDALEVMRLVRAHPTPVPSGLESRIRRSVAERLADGPVESVRGSRARQHPAAGGGRGPGWRRWGMPLAAAAGLAVAWLGVTEVRDADPGPSDADGVATVDIDYEPYGAWPASDGMVAGEPLLGELTEEELEELLEEMES